MAVSQAHRDYLRAQAISDTFVDAVCDSEPDGMVFNFVGPTGRTARQKRLDSPPDADSRFMGPAGVPSVIAREAATAFYARLRELFAEKKSITTFGPYTPGQAVTLTVPKRVDG